MSIIRPKAKSSVNLLISGTKLRNAAKLHPILQPPNRPIWLVDDQLWFADAAFCISKHPTSVKNHLQFRTFSSKSLHNPNKCLTFAAPEPPSLLTMLKSGVVLFYTTMRLLFDKSFMQPDDMVELLRHRGLEIG